MVKTLQSTANSTVPNLWSKFQRLRSLSTQMHTQKVKVPTTLQTRLTRWQSDRCSTKKGLNIKLRSTQRVIRETMLKSPWNRATAQTFHHQLRVWSAWGCHKCNRNIVKYLAQKTVWKSSRNQHEPTLTKMCLLRKKLRWEHRSKWMNSSSMKWDNRLISRASWVTASMSAGTTTLQIKKTRSSSRENSSKRSNVLTLEISTLMHMVVTV